jgi:large subunit ribosomal protein L5
MHFLNNFNLKIFKYDVLNKFLYKNTKRIPKFKKIILHFNCKTSSFKDLAISLLALELITGKRGKLTFIKKPNVLLKLRKGNPVGCKVELQNTLMFNFITRLYLEGFLKMKNFTELKCINKKNKSSNFSFYINDIFVFDGMEKHYHLFCNLNKININFITTTNNINELNFIFKSYKLIKNEL